MWERGWSFIKKAGTVILLSTVVLWFLQGFGFENGGFGMVEAADNSILAYIGKPFAWIFIPLGFGFWQAAVATITGLIAKENIVATFGVLYSAAEVAENGSEIWALLASDLSSSAALAFLVFNLLCAPCFAAMGAILLGPFFGVSLSLMAVGMTNTGIAQTLMSLTPILILWPSRLMFGTKVSMQELVGAIIAVAGASLFFL